MTGPGLPRGPLPWRGTERHLVFRTDPEELRGYNEHLHNALVDGGPFLHFVEGPGGVAYDGVYRLTNDWQAGNCRRWLSPQRCAIVRLSRKGGNGEQVPHHLSHPPLGVCVQAKPHSWYALPLILP